MVVAGRREVIEGCDGAQGRDLAAQQPGEPLNVSEGDDQTSAGI